MEPSTIKTWSFYNQSSWQSKLSKEFSWKDWRKTSLEKFVKGTRKETRKSQWQRQQENSSKYQVTVCSAEWLEDEELLQFRGKIYVPWNLNLQRQVVSLCHDTKVAGYPRRWKTLELVSRDYLWPQISRYIGQYISTCDLCIRMKLIRQAPVVKLHSLQIPDSQ